MHVFLYHLFYLITLPSPAVHVSLKMSPLTHGHRSPFWHYAREQAQGNGDSDGHNTRTWEVKQSLPLPACSEGIKIPVSRSNSDWEHNDFAFKHRRFTVPSLGHLLCDLSLSRPCSGLWHVSKIRPNLKPTEEDGKIPMPLNQALVSNSCCPFNTVIMAEHLSDSVHYPWAEGKRGTTLCWHVSCHYRNKGCLTTERNQCHFVLNCLAVEQLLHWLNQQLTNRGKIQKLKETSQSRSVKFSLFHFQAVMWSGEVLLCSLWACCHGIDWNITR